MKEPVTHIERPNLPWRHDRLTECKLPADSYPTWTREEAVAKAREMGIQRFSMFVCMTCKNTAERYTTWDESPSACMARYAGPVFRRDADMERMDAELRAIAALVEAHRDEFDSFLEGLGQAADLTARRVAKRAARRYGRGR